jgi:hypothetical protein
VTGREYLIDASGYWRIDRGAVLAGAWRDHLERGLVPTTVITPIRSALFVPSLAFAWLMTGQTETDPCRYSV